MNRKMTKKKQIEKMTKLIIEKVSQWQGLFPFMPVAEHLYNNGVRITKEKK